MKTSILSNSPNWLYASRLAQIVLRTALMFVMATLVASHQCSGQTPTSADNSAGLPPVADQGSQHSSHAWALAYYCKTYQEGRGRGWDIGVPEHQFSPSFLYNQSFSAPFDGGTSFAELLSLLASQGCATLADCPYVETDYTTWPPYTAFRDAINYRIQNYTWLGNGLTPGVRANMKSVLTSGDLCVIEVPVFKPDANTKGLFERLNSTNEFYTMPADGEVYWGANQALTVVGYDDTALAGSGAFKVVNSWGTGWGHQGFAWLSYDFIQAFASDIYTMQSRSNYQPTSFARFNLAHAYWWADSITVTIGVGDTDNPPWSKVIFPRLNRGSLTVDMAVDLTEAAAYLPPTFERTWWIRVDDHEDEDTALLSVFQIEHSGTNYNAAAVMPLTGPYFSGSFYAYVPAGTTASSNYFVNDDSIAGDRYCTAIGDDGNDGLTLATPKRSIQDVISHYVLKAGDTVWIDAGTYTLTNDIELTQLDQGTNGNPVRFVGLLAPNGEPATIISRGSSGGCAFRLVRDARFVQLENLWIKGGDSGVYCDGSGPYGNDGLVMKNVRVSNTGNDAVYLHEAGEVRLQNCRLHDFLHNGIEVNATTAVLEQTVIAASSYQAAASVYDDPYWSEGALVASNSILTATGQGAQCVSLSGWAPRFSSYFTCLFAADAASLGYSPYGYTQGPGTIVTDPLFADPAGGDFHLKSTAGRWDPAGNGSTGAFVNDVVDSPCIDAGDPFSPVGNEPIYNGARINMGAFGGTPYASKSPPDRRYLAVEQPVAGDVRTSNCLLAWRVSGTAWQPAETLLAEISANAGQTWQSIPGGNALPYDSLSFSWSTLPFLEGTNYLIRLTSNLDASTTVTNSGLFMIAHHPRSFYVNDGTTANDVYCTASGDDTQDGLTPATPKATIQALLGTVALRPGDLVFVDTGVYTLTNAITIGAANSGATNNLVRLIGSTNAAGTLFDGNGASSAVIQMNQCSFVSVEHLQVKGGEFGIGLYSAPNCVIRECRVFKNTYAGISLGDSSSGVQILNCLLDDNGKYGFFSNGLVRDLVLADNTVVRNGTCGIYYYNAYSYPVALRNNIVVASGPGQMAVYTFGSEAASDYNLFYATGGALVGSYHGVAVRTLANWQAATGQDAHSLSVDPLFVDAPNGDFHLQSTAGSWHEGAFTPDAHDSPCIDAGDPNIPFGTEPVPNGQRINLGAYGGTSQASKTGAGRLLTLGAPHGGEIWRGTYLIRWLSPGQGWNAGDTVRLEYSGDGGTTWNPVVGASALACKDGQFSWNTLPIPSGSRYRIRVTCNQDPGIQDSSDASFTIHNSNLSFYVNDSSTADDVYCTAPGDDTNDGLSPGTPKASIQALLGVIDLEPGDTVLIDTGVYTLTNTITIEAVDSGATNNLVRLVGSTNAVGTAIDGNGTISTVIQLNSCSFVSLENLRVRGGKNYGIGVYSPNCVIRGCRVYSNSYAGISLGYAASGVRILNCLLDDNGKYGFLSDQHVRDLVLANNTVAWNGSCGIYYPNDYSQPLALRNNIVVASGPGQTAVYTSGSEATSDYNLFYATGGALLGSYHGVAVPTLANWQAATGQDAHSLSMDPLFADAANGNFHLQSTAGSWHEGAFTPDAHDSPCIDAGDPNIPFGTEPVPNGQRINLGAYGGTSQASKTGAGRLLTLDAPNGGEIWRGTNLIRWLAHGQGWNAVAP